MVGHRSMGVEQTGLKVQGVMQPAEVGVTILVVEEAGAAIMARAARCAEEHRRIGMRGRRGKRPS